MKEKIITFLRSPTARDTGFLILRVIVGVSFIVHGFPKISGGVETWTGVGSAMGTFGITFAPAFWGFMAAVAEFFGGIALVLGIATRIAASGLAFTMLVAAAMHLSKGDGFNRYSHPLELLGVCALFLLAGAGSYSVDRILQSKFLKKADPEKSE